MTEHVFGSRLSFISNDNFIAKSDKQKVKPPFPKVSLRDANLSKTQNYHPGQRKSSRFFTKKKANQNPANYHRACPP
jgi:hypothetical protein